MTPTEENFREFIQYIIEENKKLKNEFVDIKSGSIHTLLGSYPGNNHRMKTCCNVMYKFAEELNHNIISSPQKGFGASLVIRYYLID
jgi:hypothetical protein